ncbi:MAG: T9SS type A sorting domain-containing protein, partial [Bacteroidia bacterium]
LTGTSNYLLPFYFTIDAVGGNMSKEQLFTFEINMQPNGGTEIACSRSKIKVHLYLSANDCQDNDTIFSVGRCYQCKAMNAQNDLYPVKYANFTMQGIALNILELVSTSHCLPTDTLFWDFGDGTSEWRLASTPSIQHTYPADGAYTTTLTLKCGNRQVACRYKVTGNFFIHSGYFPVNDLQLTIGETGDPTEVQLRWTNQLANLTHSYKLERKGKENQWITLADNLQEMEYLDTKLQYGVYHYRISAIDLEGKEVAMSEIQKVKIGGELVLFPNPVKEILSIAPPPYLNKVTTVRLLNLQGQVLQTFSILPSEIDMRTLPSGMYWLKLENDESYKIIKE